MPLYLTKLNYTPETWARLFGNPEDRRKAALSSIETTVLLTVDETMDALRKAEQVKYRPPGA